MGLGDWWDDWLADPLSDGAIKSSAKGLAQFATTGSTGNKLIDMGINYGINNSSFGQAQNLDIGYQGSIPDYSPVRERVDLDPNRQAGGKGQRYFTDMQYADRPSADSPTIEAARANALQQKIELNKRNKGMAMPPASPQPQPTPMQPTPMQPTPIMPMMAQGGIASMNQGYYLGGATDGMADLVPASIDGTQEARLSDGEFVIPADVVSHLGNGNSDAGAKELHGMMDNVRMARTGKQSQGTEINPNKFMPKVAAQGGIMNLQNGGSVYKNAKPATNFQDTGEVVSNVPETDPIQARPTNVDELDLGKTTGSYESLSPYAGPYVTEMLGRGRALADLPFESYEGQLTAGTSGLQDQAYQGIGALQTPTDMGVNQFDADAAQQYMNPYLMASLNPQIDQARRQADIQRIADAGRLTKAGAYGGSRQAVMEAEGNRALGDRIADITGQGYATAYDKGLAQFNAEQGARNQYGFDVLAGQERAGAAQRGIQQEGLSADLAQFEEERYFPYKQVQYMQSLLQGLPITARSQQYSQPSQLSQLISAGGVEGGAQGVSGLYNMLFGGGDTVNPVNPVVADNSSYFDTASDYVSDAYNSASDYASDAYDSASDYVSDAYDSATNYFS
jgi:hypothetical protein